MARKANRTGKSKGVSDAAPAPTAEKQPEPSPSTKKFAGKAHDLEALREAVVDAASVSAGLWLSYLFLFFYLFIAAAAVTHKDLLFESPVKLPFLNVELPLLGFFWLGPLLFLILHAYVLLHFALLAGKVGAFHAALQAQISDDDTRARLRRQLPSNIFVQYLAGPNEVRTGIVGLMLHGIAFVTLVIFPILLLVFFQLQFLPYHSAIITWWQRIAVLIDVLLLWTLWPSIAVGAPTWIGWRDFRRPKIASLALASLLPLLLVFIIATFPGELEDKLPSLRWVPTKLPEVKIGETGGELASEPVTIPLESLGLASPHELLVAGEVDLLTRKLGSLWSNRLVLPGLDVIDHAKFDSDAKIDALPETISLRGRDLKRAVLIGATLRNADFTGAQLQEADLSEADLRKAKFECGDPDEQEGCAHLKSARLDGAQFQGASLESAQLQGASLDLAQLQGASLESAQLQGASLHGAQLQGAWLSEAALQGASLRAAGLQGALLYGAHLQGASLRGAGLQGASLNGAELQGASLNHARLQGASLLATNLQAALLDHAGLQGADLDSADLNLASLESVSVWRSNLEDAEGVEGAFIVRPLTDQGYWSTDSFTMLRARIESEVPKRSNRDYAWFELYEGNNRDDALKWLARLDPAQSLEGEQAMADAWVKQAQLSRSRDAYNKDLATELREIGCNAEGAPYVIRGLLRDLHERFGTEAETVYPAELAKAFLDEATCPGARGLSEDDKAALRALRDSAPQASQTPPAAPTDGATPPSP